MYGVRGVDFQSLARFKIIDVSCLALYPSNASWFKNGHLMQWVPVRVGGSSFNTWKRQSFFSTAARSGAGAALLLPEGEILGSPGGAVESEVEGRENRWKMPSPWRHHLSSKVKPHPKLEQLLDFSVM